MLLFGAFPEHRQESSDLAPSLSLSLSLTLLGCSKPTVEEHDTLLSTITFKTKTTKVNLHVNLTVAYHTYIAVSLHVRHT